MNAEDLAEAERVLSDKDPILGGLIRSQTLAPREPRRDYFASLCRAVIGQQVSVAAALAISNRFEAATGFQPSAVAAMDEATVKTIGLSRQKTGYLQDLAGHFARNPSIYDHLHKLRDEEVIAELTAVRGIGIWTAQMFLIFTLARPDVFAPDDIGLQKGMQRLYGWSEIPRRAELGKAAEIWQPYRTVASLHLWQSLDATPEGNL